MVNEEAVLVTGMHRSGTSALAGSVRLLGVWLGQEEQLVPAAPDNPRGFFEHAELKELNVELLRYLDRRSDRPRLPLPHDWVHRVEPLFARAKKIIERDLAYKPFWGFKDPRICLTLPFWLRILPNAKIVFVYRDPLEVAVSLWARGGYPLPWGLHLWAAYHFCFAQHASKAQRILTVSYSQMVKRPEKVLSGVASFLGVNQDLAKRASEFVSSELYRNRRRAHEWPEAAPKGLFTAAQWFLWFSASTGQKAPLRALPLLLRSWAYERSEFLEKVGTAV